MKFRPISLFLVAVPFAWGSPVLLKADGGPVRCEIYDTVSRTKQALAPERTEIRAVITDGIAEVEVVQTFRTPLSYATQAQYVFPLPGQGAVHGMKYRQKGVWRTAEILPKERAQAIYDSVVTAGGSAALLTQSRDDIFTQALSRIEPGDTVEVRIRLSMPLTYKDGNFEFAFPTMIGSRCCNESTPPLFGTIQGWNPPPDVEGPRIQFVVAIQTGYAIAGLQSPTHPIRAIGAGSALDTLVSRGLVGGPADLPKPFRDAVVLQPLETYPNSDFVLRFSRAAATAQTASAVWADTTGWKYFRLEAFPDSSWSQGSRPDLDVLVLFDRSGSQGGWPIQHEKAVADRILGKLRPSDRICVMGFDTYHDFAFPDTIRAATAGAIDSAKSYVALQSATGSTELLSALQTLSSVPMSAGRRRLYVFLTDGFITNDVAILQYLSGLPDLQVITFGAGNNLNRTFLDQAALIGNGFSTPLVENDDLPARVEEAWGRIQSPSLSGLRLDLKGADLRDLQSSGSALYKGLSWSLLGRTRQTGSASLELVGARGPTDTVRLPMVLDLGVHPTVGWAVPKLWARATIGNLEREEYLGQTRKDSIVSISLEHQVLSKYTAFLAWDGSPDNLASGSMSTKVSYSISQPLVPTSVREVPRFQGIRSSDETLHFRLVREGLSWRLEWPASVRGSDIRVLDPQGRMIWCSKAGRAQTEARLPGRLPSFVVVQVRTPDGWKGRTLPVL